MNGPIEHPWAKARRLAKELSETLVECNEGRWSMSIAPIGLPFAVTETAIVDDVSADEVPYRRVERLGFQLAAALDDYGDGEFHAYVVPAKKSGYCVMLAHRPKRMPDPLVEPASGPIIRDE